MKAKHLLLSSVVLFCSCAKTENVELISTAGNTSESNAISVSEALTNLDNELRSIYGTDTRSVASMRKVKTINYIDFKGTRAKNGDTECPLYMSGIQSNKMIGHSWVLDGWNEYKIKNKKMLIDGTSQTVYTTTTKVHCNFGYAGSCDGYYTSGVFDASRTLNPGDIDTPSGDKAGTSDNYNSNLCIIAYDLP